MENVTSIHKKAEIMSLFETGRLYLVKGVLEKYVGFLHISVVAKFYEIYEPFDDAIKCILVDEDWLSIFKFENFLTYLAFSDSEILKFIR